MPTAPEFETALRQQIVDLWLGGKSYLEIGISIGRDPIDIIALLDEWKAAGRPRQWRQGILGSTKAGEAGPWCA